MHLSNIVLAGLSAASTVFAAPHLDARWGSGSKANGSNPLGLAQSDLEVLAFATNLENLEVNFYTLGLSMFNDSDFTAAGFPEGARGRFEQILEHELVHVSLLQSVLGPLAPQPCNYSFPVHQPADMVAISFALESTGEAAYMGGLQVLQNKQILTTAASIEGVEARQSSFLSGLNGLAPWYGPFDTPLNMTQVISLASGFIVSCPSTNFPLVVEPVPALTVTPSFNITVGTNVTVAIGAPDFSPSNFPIVDTNLTMAPNNAPSSGKFLAYFHGGLNVSFSPIAQDNTTTIPAGLAGAVWAQVVTTDQGFPELEDTVSGVAMLNIPVPSGADSSFN
ncbi:ferritin-like domain-containing protein [Phanerochaete sordida]|uniref:Ferritin-like domain-containing protein n=1 Tax=Phanerochaete sordida TaxID=48140 RepID=A0A9P3LGH1_9APHY|nr:ferritin-like domain-containing protein [Phanerochaete sordida]